MSKTLNYDLEVGSVDEEHFIAVSAHCSEMVEKPISKTQMMAIRIQRNDIPWLIEALQRELTEEFE